MSASSFNICSPKLCKSSFVKLKPINNLVLFKKPGSLCVSIDTVVLDDDDDDEPPPPGLPYTYSINITKINITLLSKNCFILYLKI